MKNGDDVTTWVERSAEVGLPVVRVDTGASELLRVNGLGAVSSWEGCIDAHAEFAGTAAETHRFLEAHPHLRRGRVASVYVKPDGIVCILRPHTHNETAMRVLKELYLSCDYTWDFRGTGERHPVDFQHLTLLFGAIRAQFYPNGFGCSIIRESPVTTAQIRALDEYFGCTHGELSVTEIYAGCEAVERLCGWGDPQVTVNRLREMGVVIR